MVSSHEIRLGNLVYPLKEGKRKTDWNIEIKNPFKVLEIKTFTCVVLQYKLIQAQQKECPEIRYGLLNPIPLTDDWLINFGFEETEFETWVHKKLDLPKIEQEAEIYGMYLDEQIWEIKYVHRLQNIVYLLTGKELELK